MTPTQYQSSTLATQSSYRKCSHRFPWRQGHTVSTPRSCHTYEHLGKRTNQSTVSRHSICPCGQWLNLGAEWSHLVAAFLHVCLRSIPRINSGHSGLLLFFTFSANLIGRCADLLRPELGALGIVHHRSRNNPTPPP